MYRIAVVGGKDSIYGFAALGMDIFPTSDSNETKDIVKRLIHENVMIFYITENVITDDILSLASEFDVSIIPIPGIYGNTNVGIKNVRRSVEKAVGSDILF